MDELQNEAAGLVKKIREHTIKSILDVEVGGDRVLRDCALSQIKRRRGTTTPPSERSSRLCATRLFQITSLRWST